MRRLVLSIFISVAFIFSLLLAQTVSAQTGTEDILEGTVTKITDNGTEKLLDQSVPYQELEIEITKGSTTATTILAKNFGNPMATGPAAFQEYQPGDKVRISATTNPKGEISYTISGALKRPSLITLTVLFILVVLAIGKIWGALSIIGLVISFLVIFKIIIPLIISGTNPVLASAVGSIIIIPLTFYISHGFNKKTHIGVVTTFISLFVTGILAIYFVELTHLTGFASEEAGFLQIERQGLIDIRGLLLAGIIIGTLGILDDVTVGQASTVQQIKKANDRISFRELYIQGMKVGQDHISSMVNTLMLVYAGSALPLLLLFFDSQKTFVDILEYELIAEEIVRMLVGSIGLVLSAPLATFLAAYLFSRNKNSQPSPNKFQQDNRV